MPKTDESQDMLEKADDTVEQIVQHLRRRPSDLIDARRLMRGFQASAVDFQQALARLEEAAEGGRSSRLAFWIPAFAGMT